MILGIRPEDLEDAALARDAPADRRLRGAVELREALGSEIMVHFTIDATPASTEEVAELAEDVGRRRAQRGRLGGDGRGDDGRPLRRALAGAARARRWRSRSTRARCISSTRTPASGSTTARRRKERNEQASCVRRRPRGRGRPVAGSPPWEPPAGAGRRGDSAAVSGKISVIGDLDRRRAGVVPGRDRRVQEGESRTSPSSTRRGATATDGALDGGPGRQPARCRSARAARSRQGLRQQGRAEADRVRASRSSRANFAPVWSSSATSTASSTASSSRAPTSRPSGTTSRAFKDAGVTRPKTWPQLARGREDAQRVRHAGVLDRRRGRLDAHRPVREHLPPPGGAGEVRPALHAQDQVDGPVGEGRAEDDGGASSATRRTSPAARRERCRPTSRRRSRRSSRPRRRRRWCSRATSCPASSRRRRRPSRSRLQRLPVPVDRELRATRSSAAATRRSCSRTARPRGRSSKYLATPEAADDLGEAGRLLLAEQEGAGERLPRRDHARDGNRDRRRAGLPLRHVRPAARRVRRHGRPGRVQALPGLPEEPEQRQRDRVAAGGGRGEGVQGRQVGG